MPGKLKDILFVLILGSISAGLLMGFRAYTLPLIERNQEVKLKSAVLEAAEVVYRQDNLDELFQKNIRKREKDGLVYYLSPDNSYIFEFAGSGLWGVIKGLITLNSDLETIENIKIIFQEETPGLGGRIAEEAFLGQFKKKRAVPRLFLALRQKAARPNEIDAISGASITSEMLVGLLNDSILEFRKVMER